MLNPAWIQCFLFDCRSPHGERGLKLKDLKMCVETVSRSPHGERGLKSDHDTTVNQASTSLPAWGAWIEIVGLLGFTLTSTGRSPHGERGLKCQLLPLCYF